MGMMKMRESRLNSASPPLHRLSMSLPMSARASPAKLAAAVRSRSMSSGESLASSISTKPPRRARRAANSSGARPAKSRIWD